jgi:hypothetical protein
MGLGAVASSPVTNKLSACAELTISLEVAFAPVSDILIKIGLAIPLPQSEIAPRNRFGTKPAKE